MNQNAQALEAHLKNRTSTTVKSNSHSSLNQISTTDVLEMLAEDQERNPDSRRYRYARKRGPHVRADDIDR